MDAGVVHAIAEQNDQLEDPAVRDLVGEARMLELVTKEMSTYVSDSIRAGRLNDQAAALVRLFKGIAQNRIVTIAFEAAGPEGAAWVDESAASQTATNFLMRQGGTIGGGTTEMARNVISERVLAMPRERRLDKDVPFRDVPRGRADGTKSNP
jgi:alkylation response protein AidB-like acyl-CoA dehydrogenase